VKAKQDLTALQSELENTDPSTAQIARYHAAIKILVSNYFSTDHPSPLMYFSQKGQSDLVKDLLACPEIQINDAFNQKVTEQQTGWFGNISTETVNGPQHNYTALVFAALAGQYQIAKLLIKHYANSQQKITEKNTLMDLINSQELSEMHSLLSGAKLEQAYYLLTDLIECKTSQKLAQLINIQESLGITKAQIVTCILNIHPQDPEKAIAVLEQANDINAFQAPKNALAAYMLRSESVFSGVDIETLTKIEARHTQLAIPQCKPLGKTYLTVYVQKTGKTHEISGALEAHGPQNLHHDEHDIFRKFDI
jgi:hypothetical protein